MPDDLQPDQGQGDASTPGIFDPYLQAVPEDAREYVAGYLKDAEKNVNGRLSQASELEKTFGPYKDVDLTGYDPETLSQLVTWHQQITSNPDAYRQFVETEAKELGITPAEAEQVIAAEDDGTSPEGVQQLIDRMAEERLAPIQAGLTQIQEEKATEIETQAIEQAFSQIQVKLGREMNKEEKADILDLGMPLAYDEKGTELPAGDASWVIKGFERLEALHATAARLFVEQKAQMPGGALSSGGVPALKPITSFEDANLAMRERLRQQT
jgi:hypothetical protein